MEKCHARHFCPVGVERNWNRGLSRHHRYPLGYGQGRPRRTRSQCWRRCGSARRSGGRGSWGYTHRAVSGRPAGQGSAAGSEKDGDELAENGTGTIRAVEAAPHVIVKVISTISPSGIAPNGGDHINDDYVDLSIGISNVVEERGGEAGQCSEANCIGKAAAVGVVGSKLMQD